MISTRSLLLCAVVFTVSAFMLIEHGCWWYLGLVALEYGELD